MKAAALVALAVLAGCAVDPYQWRRLGAPPAMLVQWVEVPEAGRECREAFGLENVAACASADFQRGHCLIITEPAAPVEIAGHELRHCFGWVHQ